LTGTTGHCRLRAVRGSCAPAPSLRGLCAPAPPPGWHDRSDHRVLWPAAPLELARLVGGEAVSSGDWVPEAGELVLADRGPALGGEGGPQPGVGSAVAVAVADARVGRPPGEIGIHLG